jgi:hypothetical protein
VNRTENSRRTSPSLCQLGTKGVVNIRQVDETGDLVAQHDHEAVIGQAPEYTAPPLDR